LLRSDAPVVGEASAWVYFPISGLGDMACSPA
jgi:hypothetical protein